MSAVPVRALFETRDEKMGHFSGVSGEKNGAGDNTELFPEEGRSTKFVKPKRSKGQLKLKEEIESGSYRRKKL